MISTRKFERPARPQRPEQTVSAQRTIAFSLRNVLRYAASVGRFALIWLGGYLGVAAIVLLAVAFST